MKTKAKIKKVSMGLGLSCLASQVFAAGFQIQEQNVTNLGLAYSGTAALAEDASTGFYNAAGLTRLGESEVVISAVMVQGSFDFTATRAIPSLPSFPPPPESLVPGENTDDSGNAVVVPAFYISKRLDDRWVVGFNITSPFGLNSKYKENGIVRYLATNSSLQTLNFSPSIAYQVLPCLSFGIGVDAQYAKAVLETRIGNGNATTDGFQKNRAEGWGYGWHAGLLWAPTYHTRLGVNFRSYIDYNVEGNTEILTPYSSILTIPIFPSAGTYSYQRVRSEIVLPETWTFSLYQDINSCLAWTADVAWTNWSRFHTLRLRYDPGATTLFNPILVQLGFPAATSGLDTDTWEHFKDARRYALGLIYNMNHCWLFRIGVAYDETPVRGDFRTARVPDSDRIWAAIGGAYTFARAWRIDFGYAHLFFKDATINEHSPFIAGSNQLISAARLEGNYDSNANILGIQMRYDFV